MELKTTVNDLTVVSCKKMWAVVEWAGERRSGVMATAAEKLKLGIYC